MHMSQLPDEGRRRLIAPLQLAPRLWLHDSAATVPAGDTGSLYLPMLAPAGGFVFGDGSHPTTRLCAGAVHQICRSSRPRAVLDVGTGTGVLARVARALGAERVVGTDIDPAALENAAANAALDASDVPLLLGDRAPDAWGGRFDLIVANILERPLQSLAPALARALAPGATLLLSGFTSVQAPALRVRYAEQGLDLQVRAQLEGWLLMSAQKDRSAIDTDHRHGSDCIDNAVHRD
jgi:ribosomal protein L11 methyltransferase